MKNKYIYINALLLIVLICISIEIRHQTDLQHISILTAEKCRLTAGHSRITNHGRYTGAGH